MITSLQRHFDRLAPRAQILLIWTVAGAVLHACLPVLHAARTVIGPVGLWLWLLPAAALGLELLWAPKPAATAIARTRRRASPSRAADRWLRRRPRPDARSAHRAGSN